MAAAEVNATKISHNLTVSVNTAAPVGWAHSHLIFLFHGSLCSLFGRFIYFFQQSSSLVTFLFFLLLASDRENTLTNTHKEHFVLGKYKADPVL